jgi:hypothetical protein
MVKLADTTDLRSVLPKEGVGSSPTMGTNKLNNEEGRKKIIT